MTTLPLLTAIPAALKPSFFDFSTSCCNESLGIETKIKLDIPQEDAYDLLYEIDKEYMQKIEKNDIMA